MVNKIFYLLLVIGWLGCDPNSNEGEKPAAPVMLDLTSSVPLNEKGIRPDPNSSGILLDWEQDEDSKATSFVIYRSNLAVGEPAVPYSFSRNCESRIRRHFFIYRYDLWCEPGYHAILQNEIVSWQFRI